MKNTNAAIYGPPSHTLDGFTIYVQRVDNGWSIERTHGHSHTAKALLWTLNDIERFADDDAAALNIAQAAYCLIHDLIRDRPGTQARAQYVASGGLYEQLEMF